jgi:hypothetical protein
MLFPESHAWTRRQRWLIAGAVIAGVVAFSALVYSYERYHRGPDYSFFIGTWRGELECLGEYRTGYRFKPDHTYEERHMLGDEEVWAPAGKWYAGGDFVYLRHRFEDASGPYDRLEPWHIDSMTPNEVRMHYEGLHGTFKRVE